MPRRRGAGRALPVRRPYAGSKVMIGLVFAVLAVFLGEDIVSVLNLLPMAVLGVLLVFAGSQLTLTIMDLEGRREFFIATLILGITLAAGFIAGMIVTWILQWEKLTVY